MLVLAGLVLGVLVGAFTAKKRGGKALDMAQYAASFAIAFMLAGLFLTILAENLL
tara:strand:- start:1442 stop:1606 length:165 start_codon:yes stop_codon:yes gene_type:complete